MGKFNVSLTVFAPIATVIEVEAEDEDAAEDKAINIVLTDPHYRVLDFNGNQQEIIGDDINIDGVEEVSDVRGEGDLPQFRRERGPGRR
jgi:hypothetical protein